MDEYEQNDQKKMITRGKRFLCVRYENDGIDIYS